MKNPYYDNNPYFHLPKMPTEWQALIEPAKDAYWEARRDNRSETDALLAGLNEYAKRYEEHN